MLLLFVVRIEALLLAAERPGLVEQLARGGAARLCWPFTLSEVIFWPCARRSARIWVRME